VILKTLPNDDNSRLARIGVVGADAPMTLKDACRDVFRDAISVATLMAEHRRDNLVIYKIGRQYFTTHNELIAMVKKCRVQVSAYRHGRQGTTETSAKSALAAARLIAARLKKSRKGTG